MILLGALPPNPRDLALFSSRMDGFFFSGSSTCRTMERLDRRVGQRRDATRAPNQARNGWRPHGRLPGQPASPDKASLALHEAGMRQEFLSLAEEHAGFFRSEKRTQALKARVSQDVSCNSCAMRARSLQRSSRRISSSRRACPWWVSGNRR
jgi:hypothetical protein